MGIEHGQSHDADLDRTDRLPILEGVIFDTDVGDDAVRMDHAVLLATPEFVRPLPIDLPSLADSVRSVEERIARQNADYETLNRTYQRVRDAEAAATARAGSLERDLAAARAALESEQQRNRDNDKALSDRSVAIDAARARVENALRESERFQGESRTLRDSLSARDATIVDVLHSLGERDAQLTALRAEHEKMLPKLEARATSATQLETELADARKRLTEISAELKITHESASALGAQLKRNESQMQGTRSELGAVKTQSTTYLELLRTREWRSGFDQNVFRELDARAGAADTGRDEIVKLERRLAEQAQIVGQLQAAATTHATVLAQRLKELKQGEASRADLAVNLAATETERAKLAASLAAREQSLVDARVAAGSEGKRAADLLATAQLELADQVAVVEQLRITHAAEMALMQADADTQEQEMTVLMAHLKEARRPVEVIEADIAQLKGQLAIKSAAIESLNEENKKLTAALERTRGALEEREFLIRRLERSESNNANALGRIQTSMERLGSVAAVSPVATAAGAQPEWTPELVRIDGDKEVVHALARRTRIGRAATCELQIDSSSVSRHHALILVGPREVIIEDLNSTNGVIVNSRKATRQLLNDGDLLTIGEIHFRYVAKPPVRPVEAPQAETPARE
jgi:chromosome segregation ATPase